MDLQIEVNYIRNQINLSWALYVVAVVLSLSPGTRILAALADLVSLIVAFGLTRRQEPYARSYGWWRIKFELVTVIVSAFIVWLLL